MNAEHPSPERQNYSCKACDAPAAVSPGGDLYRSCECPDSTAVIANAQATMHGVGGVKG